MPKITVLGIEVEYDKAESSEPLGMARNPDGRFGNMMQDVHILETKTFHRGNEQPESAESFRTRLKESLEGNVSESKSGREDSGAFWPFLLLVVTVVFVYLVR